MAKLLYLECPNFKVNKPNVNGVIFDGDAYFKSLNEALTRGLPVVDCDQEYTTCHATIKDSDIVGWVENYTYDAEYETLTLKVRACDDVDDDALAYAIGMGKYKGDYIEMERMVAFNLYGIPYWDKPEVESC